MWVNYIFFQRWFRLLSPSHFSAACFCLFTHLQSWSTDCLQPTYENAHADLCWGGSIRLYPGHAKQKHQPPAGNSGKLWLFLFASLDSVVLWCLCKYQGPCLFILCTFESLIRSSLVSPPHLNVKLHFHSELEEALKLSFYQRFSTWWGGGK